MGSLASERSAVSVRARRCRCEGSPRRRRRRRQRTHRAVPAVTSQEVGWWPLQVVRSKAKLCRTMTYHRSNSAWALAIAARLCQSPHLRCRLLLAASRLAGIERTLSSWALRKERGRGEQVRRRAALPGRCLSCGASRGAMRMGRAVASAAMKRRRKGGADSRAALTAAAAAVGAPPGAAVAVSVYVAAVSEAVSDVVAVCVVVAVAVAEAAAAAASRPAAAAAAATTTTK
eukprot:4343462-Pleurochrysis_carterae.AAC.3